MRKQRRRSASRWPRSWSAALLVHSLYLLNPKFQAPSNLQWLYSLVCVRPGQNPNFWFSHAGAHIIGMILSTKALTSWATNVKAPDAGLSFGISPVKYSDSFWSALRLLIRMTLLKLYNIVLGILRIRFDKHLSAIFHHLVYRRLLDLGAGQLKPLLADNTHRYSLDFQPNANPGHTHKSRIYIYFFHLFTFLQIGSFFFLSEMGAPKSILSALWFFSC